MGAQDVEELVRPVVEADGLELWDLVYRKESGRRLLRVTVFRPGGVDVDTISRTSERLSRRLDLEGFSGDRAYDLEVTSPGLERTLRERRHFERSVGEQVNVKTVAPVEGRSVLEGTLVSADSDGILMSSDGGERRVRYGDIASARTVFVWGPQGAKR